MEPSRCVTYRQYEIRAGAPVDPVAGEGLEPGALYQPLAVVYWRDAGGRHEAHLLDPKHHVFRNDADAIKISTALAKRFIDTKVAGTGKPASRRPATAHRVPHPAGGDMENGIVQTLVLLAVLVFAVLFFAAQRGRDRTRDRLLHRSSRRSSRSHTHRHP